MSFCLDYPGFGRIAGFAAISLTWLLSAGPAAAGYRFDDNDDYLTGASALPGWADTLARHAGEQGAIARCLANAAECEGRLRSLRHVIVKGAGLDEKKQLHLVNRYINKRRYRRDRRMIAPSIAEGGEATLSSHWATLLEFLHRGGDCEDYATAKYFLLRELGFAAEDMRVLVTYDRRARAYHAVLAVRGNDDSAWLLDSDNTIRRAAASYKFIYAVNETGIWFHQ